MKKEPRSIFEKSLKCIKITFGLDLSLIEKVRLKLLVNKTISDLESLAEQCEKPLAFSSLYVYGSFNPVGESVSRFMVKYYGLPVELANVHTSNPKEAGLYSHHKNAFNEYLRRVQSRLHLP
jgi:hypothetical protein